MLKYFLFLFLAAGLVLFYVFLNDPCNWQLRTDFSNEYPGHPILRTVAEEGSPESVHCRVFYRKPHSEQVHEEVWLYENSGSGWNHAGILETGKGEQAP